MPKYIDKKQLAKINQLNIDSLTHKDSRALAINLRFTLNCEYDIKAKDSTTSSKPSSTDTLANKRQQQKDKEAKQALHNQKEPADNLQNSKHQNKADIRKKREVGFGRTQAFGVDKTIQLKPERCISCQKLFTANEIKAYTGFYRLDLEKQVGESFYRVTNTLFHLCDGYCNNCDGKTRLSLPSIDTDIPGVNITRKGLVGPTLASKIAAFHKENGTSIPKIQAMLEDLYGIKLATGTIANTINYGGLCCEDTVSRYFSEAEEADLAHMDETRWNDAGQLAWLWVVVTTSICLYMIGRRTKAMAQAFLNGRFSGWLMSDGYTAYRDYVKRFRCWAHLLRKAEGLRKSQLSDVQGFGAELLLLMNRCIATIYAARELNNEGSIKARLTSELKQIEQLCLENKDNTHKDAKALAREFLNDWDAIFQILDMPFGPLTNNEAERALRHWVILRKVIQGTQSELGKRATCAIASIIATGKRRSEKFINTIRTCIANKLSILHHLDYKLIRLSG